MASFPTTLPIEAEPVAGRDRGSPPPRAPDGGEGGSSSDGSSAFAIRLRRARLGMVVALSAIAMIFVSFTSAYVVRQGLPTIDPRTGTLVRDWLPVRLPPLLWINTLVLVVSSGTMELARRRAAGVAGVRASSTPRSSSARIIAATPPSDEISWLGLTLFLGIAFLAGQVVAWRQLVAMGFYLDTSPSSSFVYLLTGMHGVHLLGGVFVLLFAGFVALRREPQATQLVILDVTGWYWHFMAVLWVYIFCLMKFAG